MYIRTMDLNFNYQVSITEKAEVNGDFIIEGTAINATTTSNGHTFLTEELRASAGTLKGVPLLADHKNEISSIKGKVLSGSFEEISDSVTFKAIVIDEEAKQLIKSGVLNTVSVGAQVKDVEETDDGDFILRGITFKELSLVAVPADEDATFATSIAEAYSNSHSHSENVNIVKKEDKQMKEVEEKKVKEEAEAEEESKEEAEDKTEEALKKMMSLVESISKEVISLKEKLEAKESDEDESKEEPEEAKEEPEAESESEEESEDEEEEEEEAAEEGYKIVQGHKSFSLVRAKY